MELRPRKGRSAQPPSTPTIAKPSPRQPPQSSSRMKPASVRSSPIFIPSDDEATNPKQSHDELVGSSPALKQKSDENILLADTPLSDFVKSGRKALSSTTKPKKKAASTVKKKVRKVSLIAGQDTTAMEEVCIVNDTIAVEMVCLDATAPRDHRASVEDTNAGETLTGNVSIELGGEKSSRKAKKVQSTKKKSALKGDRGRPVEETQNGEVTLEVSEAKLDRDDDQGPSLVADAPVTVNSDGCRHTLSLFLSDDEIVQVAHDAQVDSCQRKKLAKSTLEDHVQDEAPKASTKKKSRSKSANFSEESLSRKLFEETAAELDDFYKHETDMEAELRQEEMMVNEKTIKSEEMVTSTSNGPSSKVFKEIDQSDIEVLQNGGENFEKSDASPVEEDLGKECTQNNEPEESLHQELFSRCEKDEDIGNGHDDTLKIKLDKLKGDAIHSEDYYRTDDNNDSDASSSEDEDEVDFASVFASSVKAHLHMSEPSALRESPSMQSEQDVQKGGKSPFTKDAMKDSLAKGNISRLGLLWAPKVALVSSKNGRLQQAGASEARPNNVWQKDRCLQEGLCVPPVDPVKLNKLARKQKKDTKGDKWYNLSASTITPELKKELQLVKLRGVLDPKRHYKAEDSKGLPKYFQVGTVIGGPADFYSGRLTNKERKNSLANELLSDSSLSAYRKRKYLEIQDHKQAGGKGFIKKKKSKRMPAWAKI